MIGLEAIEKILVEGGTDEAIRLLDEYVTLTPEPSDLIHSATANKLTTLDNSNLVAQLLRNL